MEEPSLYLAVVDKEAFVNQYKAFLQHVHQQNYEILKKAFGSEFDEDLLCRLAASSKQNYIRLEGKSSGNHRLEQKKKIERYLSLLQKAYDLKQEIFGLSNFEHEIPDESNIRDIYFYDLITSAESSLKRVSGTCLEGATKALSDKQILKIKAIKAIFYTAKKNGLSDYKAFQVISALLGYSESNENIAFFKKAILTRKEDLTILIVKNNRPIRKF